MSLLAPWLQAQLQTLMQRSGHAFLLQGSSGLGQYELGLALAAAWLCHQPQNHGACGNCPSCHGIDVRAHTDLSVLMPETDMLALGWPLSEKAQKDIDEKTRKPSREIRVDAMRQLLVFTQTTSASANGKVVLISAAARMNPESAHTLLKTLEEPPGNTRFILACHAAHELLPTVRSRCQTHSMLWPATDIACQWLAEQGIPQAQTPVILQAAGGRPVDALAMYQAGIQADHWHALPVQLSRGDPGALAQQGAGLVLSSLQKICHDMLQISVGGTARFFQTRDLPRGAEFSSLSQWSRELLQMAKTVDHPYQQGLLLEAWVSRAQQVLSAKH